ncbi:MAG: DNA-primase RepB domain-containing protein [Rubrobacteraceae bacterium]
MYGDEAAVLWQVLYGAQRGLLGLHSALRPAPGVKRLSQHRSRFFDYPNSTPAATAWCLENSDEGLEAYFCAHLLLGKRRIKANAAPVMALWADADGLAVPAASVTPEPTAIVESSPGRAHLFWRLTRPVEPARAEELNRRILTAIGADRSGWDLSQLLRPPGTRNRKYEESPTVRLLELDDGIRYHPRELEITLPALEEPEPPRKLQPPEKASGTRQTGPVDLSRLSPRMRNLIVLGNTAAGKPYPTRSHADFAVAIAMFGARFEEREVWDVLSNPHNGISERYRDRGRYGYDYLFRTIGKARERALPYSDFYRRSQGDARAS